MAIVKLENVSFNKLKEFTSLGNKRNTTIKGKFTLIGEYELITKDGGESMTLNQLAKFTMDFAKRQEEFNNKILKLINDLVTEVKALRHDLDKVIEINHLKSYK